MSILNDEQYAEIVTWLPNGKGFVISDKKRFASEILPKHFSRKSKFTSFTRKLNRWYVPCMLRSMGPPKSIQTHRLGKTTGTLPVSRVALKRYVFPANGSDLQGLIESLISSCAFCFLPTGCVLPPALSTRRLATAVANVVHPFEGYTADSTHESGGLGVGDARRLCVDDARSERSCCRGSVQ